MEIFHKMISAALNLPEKQISNTLGLLAEGATIPFISRYRKEIPPYIHPTWQTGPCYAMSSLHRNS